MSQIESKREDKKVLFKYQLHVGYVFRMFDNRDLVMENKNNIILDKNEINGKVIN